MFKIAALMIVPAMVSVYTFSFGRYTWRQGNKRGALGVYALALGTVGVPLIMLLAKL